ELIPLLSDPARLSVMARKSEALGIRNADQRMADLVLEAVSA
ncbi:UDP-N-acetylglucosamine--N-acetylmuramyl-(pentapeptide) pyrophosphoryl-undecaprenol N-acetylglucosamine transferase, partial [Paenarthrobacter sp. RAF9]